MFVRLFVGDVISVGSTNLFMARPTIPPQTSKIVSLMRLFKSEFFDMTMAVMYLNTYKVDHERYYMLSGYNNPNPLSSHSSSILT